MTCASWTTVSIQTWWYQRTVSGGCRECWRLSRNHFASNVAKSIWTFLEKTKITYTQELLRKIKTWVHHHDQTRVHVMETEWLRNPKEITCASQLKRPCQQFLRRGIHSACYFKTHNSTITGDTYLPQWYFYSKLWNTNSLRSCWLVCWFSMTTHPLTSHTNHRLLWRNVAS